MLTFKESISRAAVVNLDAICKGFKTYSHGPQHKGYMAVGKTIDWKKVHDLLIKSGYKHTHTLPGEPSYRTYTKDTGGFAESKVVLAFKGGKLWTVEQNIVKDLS
jgi:hypothetical protein